MKSSELITFIVIHLVVPAIGVVAFIAFCHQMAKAKIQNPPYFQMFILFFNFGGILLILLTSLFWMWSGMASLGFFYLALGSPITAGVAAFSLRKQQKLSKFHKGVFIVNVCYAVLMITATLVWLIVWIFNSGSQSGLH